MRHSATRAILERDDVIIVASVSCIYGIGSVETYSGTAVSIASGDKIDRNGRHRAGWWRCNTGATTTISPAAPSACAATRSIFSRRIMKTAPGGWNCSAMWWTRITEFDPLTGHKAGQLDCDQGLCQFALCDAAPHAAAGDEGHQGRS